MRLRHWRIPGRAAIAVALLLLGMVLLPASIAPAWAVQDERASLLERRVKAALLYRFINYVEWPQSSFEGPDAPFTIAIAGADALAFEMADFAAGRSVLDRPLAVRRLRPGEPAKDVHMVFVGLKEADRLETILRAVPQNALVVTEWNDALRQGSVINFLLVDGQVRFEISLEAAQKRHIRLSSRLLSVAYNVRP